MRPLPDSTKDSTFGLENRRATYSRVKTATETYSTFCWCFAHVGLLWPGGATSVGRRTLVGSRDG